MSETPGVAGGNTPILREERIGSARLRGGGVFLKRCHHGRYTCGTISLNRATQKPYHAPSSRSGGGIEPCVARGSDRLAMPVIPISLNHQMAGLENEVRLPSTKHSLVHFERKPRHRKAIKQSLFDSRHFLGERLAHSCHSDQLARCVPHGSPQKTGRVKLGLPLRAAKFRVIALRRDDLGPLFRVSPHFLRTTSPAAIHDGRAAVSDYALNNIAARCACDVALLASKSTIGAAGYRAVERSFCATFVDTKGRPTGATLQWNSGIAMRGPHANIPSDPSLMSRALDRAELSSSSADECFLADITGVMYRSHVATYNENHHGINHFDIACRRIEAAQRQTDLFISAPIPEPPEDARLVDLFHEPGSV